MAGRVKGAAAPKKELLSYEAAAKRLSKRHARRLRQEYTRSGGWNYQKKQWVNPTWTKVVPWAKKNLPDVGRPWDVTLCIMATNRLLNWGTE